MKISTLEIFPELDLFPSKKLTDEPESAGSPQIQGVGSRGRRLNFGRRKENSLTWMFTVSGIATNWAVSTLRLEIN